MYIHHILEIQQYIIHLFPLMFIHIYCGNLFKHKIFYLSNFSKVSNLLKIEFILHLHLNTSHFLFYYFPLHNHFLYHSINKDLIIQTNWYRNHLISTIRILFLFIHDFDQSIQGRVLIILSLNAFDLQ